jgi:ribosomal protein L28
LEEDNGHPFRFVNSISKKKYKRTFIKNLSKFKDYAEENKRKKKLEKMEAKVSLS